MQLQQQADLDLHGRCGADACADADADAVSDATADAVSDAAAHALSNKIADAGSDAQPHACGDVIPERVLCATQRQLRGLLRRVHLWGCVLLVPWQCPVVPGGLIRVIVPCADAPAHPPNTTAYALADAHAWHTHADRSQY